MKSTTSLKTAAWLCVVGILISIGRMAWKLNEYINMAFLDNVFLVMTPVIMVSVVMLLFVTAASREGYNKALGKAIPVEYLAETSKTGRILYKKGEQPDDDGYIKVWLTETREETMLVFIDREKYPVLALQIKNIAGPKFYLIKYKENDGIRAYAEVED